MSLKSLKSTRRFVSCHVLRETILQKLLNQVVEILGEEGVIHSNRAALVVDARNLVDWRRTRSSSSEDAVVPLRTVQCTPTEMTKEACYFAEISQFAYAESSSIVQRIGDSVESMEESTDKDYLKKCSEVEKIPAEMIEELGQNVKYTMDAENACIEAEDMAENGNEKKTEECLKDAKKAAAENDMKGLESVQKGQAP